MKRIFTRLLFLRAIVIMASFVFIGCEKSTGALGLELVDDSKAILGLKRDIPVIAYTEKFDSINATNTFNGIAGYRVDPIFGITDNRLISQLNLESFSPDFGDSAVADSAILLLNYSGYYGDTTIPMTFTVNEIEEELLVDSTYYSNRDFEEGLQMGSATFTPRPTSKIKLENVPIAASLKIPIDRDWAHTRIVQASRLDKQYFSDNENFVKHIKGIKVKAESLDGSSLYFNMVSAFTRLRVYYRSNPVKDTVSSSYDIITGENFTNINTANFDYSSAEFDLEDQDTLSGEDYVYVQPMGGVATVLDFSALQTYKDSAFIVNRAEVIMHIRPGTAIGLNPPSQLFMIEDKNGTKVQVKDLLIGISHFGGALETDFFRNRKYVFNLTKQINDYINTETVINKIYILPAGSTSFMDRAVLGGNLNSSIPVEFKLYFTRTK